MPDFERHGKASRLTQLEAAVKLGVNRNTIIGWEAGAMPREKHHAAMIALYELPEAFFWSPYGGFEERIAKTLEDLQAEVGSLTQAVWDLQRDIEGLVRENARKPG